MQQDDLLNIDESILLLIDEFIHNNLKFFCKYDFNEKIINYVFDNIIILVYIENLWDIINENLKYYFQTIGIPRSYINSPIIQKFNIPIWVSFNLLNSKQIRSGEFLNKAIQMLHKYPFECLLLNCNSTSNYFYRFCH